MRLKKCGEFMEKDGVVVKRPGKKFVCPQMPKKMLLPCNDVEGKVREDIDQMNALMEIEWRKNKKNEYQKMKQLYYFQQLLRFVRRTAENITRVVTRRTNSVSPEKYILTR